MLTACKTPLVLSFVLKLMLLSAAMAPEYVRGLSYIERIQTSGC